MAATSGAQQSSAASPLTAEAPRQKPYEVFSAAGKHGEIYLSTFKKV